MESNENPYSPPTPQPAGETPFPTGAFPHEAFRLEDPRWRGRIALGLFSLAAILDTVVTTFMAIAPERVERQWPLDKVSLCVPLFSISGIVVYLMWLHRCAKNARYLHGSSMRIGPGMAVGCYFIPFYNMIAPLLSLGEIVEITERHNPPPKSASKLLIPWWFIWLGSIILLSYFETDMGIGLIGRLAWDVALVLISLIILRLSAAQAAIVIDPTTGPAVVPPSAPNTSPPPPVEYDY